MKRHVWRPGDQLRVVNPRWVRRVGYPLVWYELMPEVEADLKVGQAWDLLNSALVRGVPNGPIGRGPTDGVPHYFLQAAAKALVARRGFGGNERQIFYEEGGSRAGAVLEVLGKRVVKTGTRFPAAYGQDHDGEHWEDPGGLDNEKTHILLRTYAGEIEAANVELVSSAKPPQKEK